MGSESPRAASVPNHGGSVQEGRAALEAARADAVSRSRFLASMGHSLRTPLNGVLGYGGILLEEAFGPLNERQRGYVERILASGNRQLEMIDNLVLLAEIQAGELELELELVGVADLTRGSVSQLREAAESAEVTLTVSLETEGEAIRGDQDYLDRALRNVVDNAIRYMEGPGSVGVRAVSGGRPDDSGAGTGTGWVSIEVSDEGPGIAVEDQALLLDDYQNAEALALRRQRRSGLGLPLARRIIELHGGQLHIESEGRAGHGTRVHIYLPVAEQPGRPS